MLSCARNNFSLQRVCTEKKEQALKRHKVEVWFSRWGHNWRSRTPQLTDSWSLSAKTLRGSVTIIKVGPKRNSQYDTKTHAQWLLLSALWHTLWRFEKCPANRTNTTPSEASPPPQKGAAGKSPSSCSSYTATGLKLLDSWGRGGAYLQEKGGLSECLTKTLCSNADSNKTESRRSAE